MLCVSLKSYISPCWWMPCSAVNGCNRRVKILCEIDQTWSQVSKKSCSSVTVDQVLKLPGSSSALRRLIWWAWQGWSACSVSDRQQTCDSLQRSRSNFLPLCLWSRAHQWGEQHSCPLSPLSCSSDSELSAHPAAKESVGWWRSSGRYEPPRCCPSESTCCRCF